MEKALELKIADKLDVSQAEADKIWNAVEVALIEAIQEDEDSQLRLRGFGTFKIVQRPAQQIEHPVTGEVYDVPAYKAVDFRASAALKKAVNPDLDIPQS